ncbi:MAG: Holliday junction branch migration protein RuvA [Clostridiaceae bacterium]|jgi:Holliday junction DNA helicase RuvA|nr:Holliday junction branch migration protein RuvA [Clostridiaceae bacterium]
MYAFITGTVAAVAEGQIVLENNGIGYALQVSNGTVFECGTIGKTLRLYTYLQVKEDLFCLYGFASETEKDMFLRLIGISGIGPKAALAVLSGCDVNTLSVCIATGDVKTLSKIKGLGKKTAERIILELREKVVDDGLTTMFGESGASGGAASDAVSALIALGVSKAEAAKAVAEAAKKTDKTDELIALALKRLS